MKRFTNLLRFLAISLLMLSLGGCQPNVYGSIGVSSWGGHRGGPNVHGNVSVGGRICC